MFKNPNVKTVDYFNNINLKSSLINGRRKNLVEFRHTCYELIVLFNTPS